MIDPPSISRISFHRSGAASLPPEVPNMAVGKAIWELGAYRSLFADPFAEGNELESVSHCAEALLVRDISRERARDIDGWCHRC